MIPRYTAICIQSNRACIGHRKEIRKAALDRALELIDFAAPRFSLAEYAPAKLVLFPEVFLQGWCVDAGPYSSTYERVAKDIAIRIPGEETDLLAEMAKKWNLYIAGTAMEVDPEIDPNYFFNCGFVIGPKGNIVYKRHKYHPAISQAGISKSHPCDGISPHDLYDKYLEAMDGKYGRKKGDALSCLFPVVETDIGKLGYNICMEGFFTESFRALGIQGCEVALRSSGNVIPWGLPPYDSWELQNRSAAQSNMMYVLASNPGDTTGGGYPKGFFTGDSMIVDFNGALICRQTSGGESATGAVIDIESLRKRRTDPGMNYLPLLRTEIFREMYTKPIYPKNLYKDRLPTSFQDRMAAQPVKKLLEERIFVPPSN